MSECLFCGCDTSDRTLRDGLNRLVARGTDACLDHWRQYVDMLCEMGVEPWWWEPAMVGRDI